MKFLFPLLAILACASAFVQPVARPSLQRAPMRSKCDEKGRFLPS